MKKQPSGIAEEGQSSIDQAEPAADDVARTGSQGGESTASSPAPSEKSRRHYPESEASEWPGLDDMDEDDRFCTCLDGWLPECLILVLECICTNIHSWLNPARDAEDRDVRSIRNDMSAEKRMRKKLTKVSEGLTLNEDGVLSANVLTQYQHILDQIKQNWMTDKSSDQPCRYRVILAVSLSVQDADADKTPSTPSADGSIVEDFTQKNLKSFTQKSMNRFYQVIQRASFNFESFNIVFVQIKENLTTKEKSAEIHQYHFDSDIDALSERPLKYEPTIRRCATKEEFGAALKHHELLTKYGANADDFDFAKIE